MGCVLDGDFRVGPWLVAPSLNRVSRNGTTVQLEPKVMSVLVCLAADAPEAVSKEKLLQTVWPDTFVGEGVLVRSIVELRRLFEDDAKEPRVIQTIAKRGYRLVAPVVPGNGRISQAAAPAVGGLHSGHLTASKWKLWLLVVAGVVLLCGLLVTFNVAHLKERLFGRSGPTIRSLAVLPLQNLSGDPGQEYFSDGMTEELITELSRIKGLRVISRTSVMNYKQSRKLLPEIARELNVDAIVEGSVLRSGDRVRITAQLISAPNDTNLWAEAYDRDVRDVLTLQANVATDVAQEVHSQVTPHQAASSGPRPVNLAVLDAYLKGAYHRQKWGSGGSPDERYKAAEYFRQATKLDPSFARGWLGLADSYVVNVGPSPNEVPLFKDALEKALAADPGLSGAHSLMGRFKLYHDWDFPAAEKEIRTAIELNPSNAEAHGCYADYLYHMGQRPEAEREEQLAQALDPNNDWLEAGLAWRGEYDRALERVRNLVELHPEDGWNHWELSNVYFAMGRYDEGVAELEPTLRQYGYPEMANALAKTHAAKGYKAALRLYAKDLAAVQGNPVCPTLVAKVYLLLGEKDEAFKWLEKGFAERDGFLLDLKHGEWQSLRGDPRYEDLVRRMNFPAS